MAGTQFFQNQQSARDATQRLVILFILAVGGVVAAMNALAYVWMSQAGRQRGGVDAPVDPRIYLGVTVVTLLVIFLGSAWRRIQLREGGRGIAILLGGMEVPRATTDPDERKLLNVVEEMAIASGVPVPPVFVLPEDSINAFAAGEDAMEAVIGVTHGCMQKLSRDELQGVIAHEFSHIFNGDMRLNLKLIGTLAGIQVIGSIGIGIVRAMGRGPRVSSRRSSKNNGAAQILLIGLALAAIGYIGVFFARLIKSAISRQREFLADASAIQYTRNPLGIGGALFKINQDALGSAVSGTHAEEASHMFFGAAVRTLFKTHPPVEERLKRIDPRLLTPAAASLITTDTLPREPQSQPKPSPTPTPDSRRQAAATAILSGEALSMLATDPEHARVNVTQGAVFETIGQPTAHHRQGATEFLRRLPPDIRSATRHPRGARAVVCALVVPSSHHQPLVQLSTGDAELYALYKTLSPIIESLGSLARIPLLELALPTLKSLPTNERQGFLLLLKEIIWADQQCETFEYALFTILKTHLGPQRRGTRRPQALPAIAPEAGRLLSVLAHFSVHEQSTSNRSAEQAFQTGTQVLKAAFPRIPSLTLDAQECGRDIAALERALAALADLAPAAKATFIEACLETVFSDNQVGVEEFELLHAFCTVLEIPLPPLALPVSAGSADQRQSSTPH